MINFLIHLRNPERLYGYIEDLTEMIEEIEENVGSLKSPELKEFKPKVNFKPKDPLREMYLLANLEKKRKDLIERENQYKTTISRLINDLTSQDERQIITCRYIYMFPLENIAMIIGIPKKEIEGALMKFIDKARKIGEATLPVKTSPKSQ